MLYAIGDLHLSLQSGKEMDIFGGAWVGYTEKIRAGLAPLSAEDTLVLCGDTSWGLNLAQSLPDFQFLEGFPCKKWLVKGNHDYFWDTATKQKRFFAEHGLKTFDILHNGAVLHGDKALCGTRGWFYEEEKSSSHDEKIYRREILRLGASLDAGRRLLAGAGLGDAGELLVFLHYPPFCKGYRCEEILSLLRSYGVRRCYYGHLHGAACARALEGVHEGIDFTLISADHLGFQPLAIE